MSIQSTKEISRDFAIHRILKINALFEDHKYKDIADDGGEDMTMSDFLDAYDVPLTIHDIGQWTDDMLENVIDMPFFRGVDNHYVCASYQSGSVLLSRSALLDRLIQDEDLRKSVSVELEGE